MSKPVKQLRCLLQVQLAIFRLMVVQQHLLLLLLLTKLLTLLAVAQSQLPRQNWELVKF